MDKEVKEMEEHQKVKEKHQKEVKVRIYIKFNSYFKRT